MPYQKWRDRRRYVDVRLGMRKEGDADWSADNWDSDEWANES